MKFKIAQVDNYTAIYQAETHDMKVDFINLTPEKLELPDKYFSPSCHQYDIQNALILGNRSCLVGENLYIDTPSEWKHQELLDYVARVKKIHSREFSFISNYTESTGEGQLEIPRPYIQLDDVFFCGGVEYWNFGFFLTVLMQKIFLASTIDEKRPILVPICDSWQVALLQTFFPNTNFIFYDAAQVVSVSKATVISWPGFGFHIYSEYLEYLRSKIADFDLDNATARQHIYFTRRDGVYGKRLEFTKLLGEHFLSQGRTPVYPELLSPARIAKIMNGCKSLLLDSGSALFNLIFAKCEVNVTLFESRPEFLLNHSRFINSCGNNSRVIFVDPTSNLTEVKRILASQSA